MRIPKLNPVDVAYRARIITTSTEFYSLDELEAKHINDLCIRAEAYCAAQTGLLMERFDGADGDVNADLAYAGEIIAFEMYDNRQGTAQYTAQNPVVTKILAQHSRNLIPEVV